MNIKIIMLINIDLVWAIAILVLIIFLFKMITTEYAHIKRMNAIDENEKAFDEKIRLNAEFELELKFMKLEQNEENNDK